MNRCLACLCSQPDFLWPANTTVMMVKPINKMNEFGVQFKYMLQGSTVIHDELETCLKLMEELYPHEYEVLMTQVLNYACGRLIPDEER